LAERECPAAFRRQSIAAVEQGGPPAGSMLPWPEATITGTGTIYVGTSELPNFAQLTRQFHCATCRRSPRRGPRCRRFGARGWSDATADVAVAWRARGAGTRG
jgi:hypothetical protein